MRFENLTVSYGEKRVFDDFSLSLEEGRITAILGESGTGKSTLLNAAVGLIPFEGKIEGVGKSSYLFQKSCLLPNLTVEGNLQFVLPKELWTEIPSVLEKVGLIGREKHLPRTLSGGEAQRVAIARAFLFPHDTLFMDEPFSSLDLKLKSSLLSLVSELWKERKNTVLFVTHDVREAVLLAHRAVVLKGGKIVEDVSLQGELPRDFFSKIPEEELLIRALMQ